MDLDIKKRVCANCEYMDRSNRAYPCKICDDDRSKFRNRHFNCNTCAYNLRRDQKEPCANCTIIDGRRSKWLAKEERKSEIAKSCYNCFFVGYGGNSEPCKSCDLTYCNFIMKEERK